MGTRLLAPPCISWRFNWMFFLLPSLAPFLWARAASWRVLHVENSLEHTSWYCINNQLSIILTQRLTMSSLIGKEEWMHVSVIVTISVISLLPLWLSLHYSLTDQASSPPTVLRLPSPLLLLLLCPRGSLQDIFRSVSSCSARFVFGVYRKPPREPERTERIEKEEAMEGGKDGGGRK